MASMTDVIFLLLIFFMITSTVVSPNAIKVLLPQGKQQTSAKPLTRVVIDKDLNFYAAFGNEKEQPVALNDLTSFLQSCAEKEPEMYVALYADESVLNGAVLLKYHVISHHCREFYFALCNRQE